MNVITGVIKEGETNRMLRLLYRVSRGKVASFFKNIGTDICDYTAGKGAGERLGSAQPVSYAVYVLVFTESDYLRDKIEKIAQSFSIN